MIETLGRYKILSVIGQGAMGVVYKAIDPVIDRTVAIKTINLNLSSDEIAEYEARFQQEIKAAGRLNHPNIVTIFDVGKTEAVAYMAMELLEGRELKNILAEDGLPLVADTVEWTRQVAQGLAAAHEQSIIHRDVKPSNIMIVKGGFAKITDFGIARMNASAVKTMTGLILGSPRYMSPEQVIGRALDHRTDIFSLGVVLYETLTGLPPFDGDNVNAIMYATVNHVPAAPSTINQSVEPMLDLIVAKALAKTVDDRYQSMQELAQDLQALQRQMTPSVPNAKVIAREAPAPAKPMGLDALHAGRYQKTEGEEPVQPLHLAKKFDSFDATVKLAAMTKQTNDFQQYISETQKMRAYQGEIGGALAASAPAPAAPKPASPALSPQKVDTATVPIASLHEMEAAAEAHAAHKTAAKPSPPPAPIPAAPTQPVALLPLAGIAALGVAAIVLIVLLLR